MTNDSPNWTAEAQQALERLAEGSRAGSAAISAVEAGGAPPHTPFAAVLACSDARAPTELVFNQCANDLFVVRLAGEALGAEGLGSLIYAVENLPSLRLLVVLGHTHCGAVIAAVKKYLAGETTGEEQAAPPSPVEAVLAHLGATVIQAAGTLERVYGQQARRLPNFAGALVELEVALNAAATAGLLSDIAGVQQSGLPVVYGVYDLPSAQVGRPGAQQDWQEGLFAAPAGPDELQYMADQIARGPRLRALLKPDIVP